MELGGEDWRRGAGAEEEQEQEEGEEEKVQEQEGQIKPVDPPSLCSNMSSQRFLFWLDKVC